MSPGVRARLFGFGGRLDDPVVVWLGVAAGAVLLLAGVAVLAASARSWGSPRARELRARWATWAVLAPAEFALVAFGAVSTALGVLALSALCFREFARATGLFREPIVSLIFVASVVVAAFSAVDNRFAMFTALPSCATVAIAVACLARDEPKGYLQRVALGVVGVLLIGVGPAYLTMFTIDTRAAPVILMLLFATAIGDVGAFAVGRLVGGPKLAPRTSPNKTIAGSLGGLIATAAFVTVVAGAVYRGTTLDRPHLLVMLGLLVGVAGQTGDLVLSSIKRDVGIKDFGASLPGHGGLLDRFDSIILTAPAAFYFIAYFHGVGTGSVTRVLTG